MSTRCLTLTVPLLVLAAGEVHAADGDERTRAAVCRSDDGRSVIQVTSRWGRFMIDPARAGRISSWTPTGLAHDLANHGLGVGNAVRRESGVDFTLPYAVKINTKAGAVEVVLTSGKANRELLDGFEFEKTFVFRDATPYVQLKVRVTNHGAGKLLRWRQYNDLTTSEKNTGASFQDGPAGRFANRATQRKWLTTGVGAGWGGVSTGRGCTVVFRLAAEQVTDVMTWCSSESAAYEPRFRYVPLDTGATFTANVFFAAFNTDSIDEALVQARSAEHYTAEIRALAEAPIARKREKVALTEKSNRILIVGRHNRYRFYRTEAAAGLPEWAGRLDHAPVDYATRAGHPALGFPVSAAGIAKYRLIVLVDVAHFSLTESGWELLEQFVRAGGTVVFLGHHSVEYEGTPIAKLIPAVSDYTAIKKTAAHRHAMPLDRTPYAALEAADPSDGLVKGLDYTSKPQVCVHKSVARKRAVVHLTAGRWPVLTSWQVGQGTVYSFPICLTAFYRAVHDCDEPEFMKAAPANERADSVFWWDHYDDLWRRLAARAMAGAEAVQISRFEAVRSDKGRTLDVKVRVTNAPSHATATLSLTTAGQAPKNVSVPLATGAGAVTMRGLPGAQEIAYVLTVRDGDRELARRDGSVARALAPAFEIAVGDHNGLCRVFRRDHAVPYVARFHERDAGPVALTLVDPWLQVVWQGRVAPAQQASGIVPLAGLACGRYVLQARLGQQVEESILHVLPDVDLRDTFFTSGSLNFTDAPEDHDRLIATLRETGMNSPWGAGSAYRRDAERWPMRYRRAFGDRLLVAGLFPVQHYGAIVGGWYSPAFQSDEELRTKVVEELAVLKRTWGMAPRGTRTYIYDEPNYPYRGGPSKVVDAAYEREYGKPAPKGKQDPGYYRWRLIKDQEIGNSTIRKAKIYRELDAEGLLVPFGLTNQGGSYCEHSLLIARAFPGFGLDFFSYSPGAWKSQFAFDITLAAHDFNPRHLGFQLEADSFYGGTPIGAQRGQMTYSALARGAQWIHWYDWDFSRMTAGVGITPTRFVNVVRASREALAIGPLFGNMKRVRAKLAMLVPQGTQFLAIGSEGRRAFDTLTAAYKAAQVSSGNVDFLYYRQIREGELANYKVMLIAGCDWVEEDILAPIKKWVIDGGTLLLAPRSGMFNENRQPSAFYRQFCGVEFGAEIKDASVRGLQGDIRFACALEASAGEVLYRFADGTPAAQLLRRGQGRLVALGFVPALASDMQSVFAKAGVDPMTARSRDQDASGFLLSSGGAHYCVVVNSENRAKKTQMTLRPLKPDLSVAYDLLTGKEQPISKDAGGDIRMTVEIEPFWGRAFVLLPAKPVRVTLEVPENVSRGKGLTYQVRVLDQSGAAVPARLMLDLEVTDATGRQRKEYGGQRVTRDGVYDLKARLGTNDPVGTWTIVARQPLTGHKAKATFVVAE